MALKLLASPLNQRKNCELPIGLSPIRDTNKNVNSFIFSYRKIMIHIFLFKKYESLPFHTKKLRIITFSFETKRNIYPFLKKVSNHYFSHKNLRIVTFSYEQVTNNYIFDRNRYNHYFLSKN